MPLNLHLETQKSKVATFPQTTRFDTLSILTGTLFLTTP